MVSMVRIQDTLRPLHTTHCLWPLACCTAIARTNQINTQSIHKEVSCKLSWWYKLHIMYKALSMQK